MCCSVCKYEWCWICGFKDVNGENAPKKGVNPHDVIVIPCSIFGLMTELKWYYGIPAGILLFALVPIIMFFALTVLQISIFCKTIDKSKCLKNSRAVKIMEGRQGKWWLLITIPLWICIIAFFAAISVLIILIGIIPFYISALLVFIRMIWWWNIKRINEQ
jgi:hypothetical protein